MSVADIPGTTAEPPKPKPPRKCPSCQRLLADGMTPHCRDKRPAPCGWVVCTGCGATSDVRGNYWPWLSRPTTGGPSL